MNLEAIYFISQVIAAVALVGSLVFVGIQIRQNSEQTRLNTQAVRSAFHHSITDSFNNLNTHIFEDAETARLTRQWIESSEPLEGDERLRMDFLQLSYHRVFETIYYERQFDTSDGNLYEAEMRTLRWYTTIPNFSYWWSSNPFSFSDEYRDFVQSLIDEHEARERKLADSDTLPEEGSDA